MPRVIITGAPGVGKTTLLSALANLGYATVPESARAVIVERRARGETPRPDPATFAREVFRRDKLKHDTTLQDERLVFFDRSAVESLGSMHEASPLAEADLMKELAALSFHRTVFVLPPWEEIYQTDSERDHTFAHALRVHHSLLSWYQRCGFLVHEVPRARVEDRVQHLLHALGDA
jgi:predicted ATPase